MSYVSHDLLGRRVAPKNPDLWPFRLGKPAAWPEPDKNGVIKIPQRPPVDPASAVIEAVWVGPSSPLCFAIKHNDGRITEVLAHHVRLVEETNEVRVPVSLTKSPTDRDLLEKVFGPGEIRQFATLDDHGSLVTWDKLCSLVTWDKLCGDFLQVEFDGDGKFVRITNP